MVVPCIIIMTLLVTSSAAGSSSTHRHGVAPPAWGSDCPRECQCHSTSLGHVTMARWVDPSRHGASSSSRVQPTSTKRNWLHRTTGSDAAAGNHDDEDHKGEEETGESGATSANGTTVFSSTPVVKVVMCLLGQDTLLSKLWRKIPYDTQVLTVLQTQSAPPMVLMEQHVRPLQHLLALEIRGHASSPSTSHLALGSEALRPLRRLQYLSLASVDLSAQPVGLSKKRSLRYLNLQHNQLEALPQESLIGQLALEELSVTQNDFREIPPLAFIDMPSLRRLFLHDNRLQTLDANSFVNLDELEMLDLSRNNISDLSMLSFPPMPRLRWLHLQDNPVQVIFLNAFHFLNSTVSVTLGHRTQPTHVMKMSFVGLSSLRALTLNNVDNQILEKDMFQGLTSLRSLTLRGRHLRVVGSETFVGAHTRLEQLILGGNGGQLRRIAADAFQGLKALRSLCLAGNAIAKLPLGVFDPLKSLQELELQHNQLHYLPTQLIAHLHLQMLRLEGNPWHCTCAMAKWPRSALARGRAPASDGKRCSQSPANSLDNGIVGGAGEDSAIGGCGSHQHQRAYVRVRDLSKRPICQAPASVSGKRVLEAIRKDLHCHDQS